MPTVELKKSWILSLTFLTFTGFVFGASSIQLDFGWKMHTGDNPKWADPEFDDSNWEAIKVGVSWEDVGYADYDGYAWYRLKFDIPKTWKEQEQYGFLSLSLGIIDDVDITFFNGEKIGATGSFPPDYKTGYYTPRYYRVPTKLIRWGEQNVLAVRVYDAHSYGGISKGPFVLKHPETKDVIDIHFELEDSDGLYFSPDSLPATIHIQNHSTAEFKLKIVYELTNDRIDSTTVLERIDEVLDLKGKETISKKLLFSPPPPGFYYVKCTLHADFEKSMLFGYEPEKIITPLTRQPDFKDFWQKRKQELEAVKPEFKVTKSDQSNDKLDVYLVEMQSYGNVTIRGWYTVPTSPGPHPAILSLPGYTSTMWPNMDRTNVATFALNPRGHGNSKDDLDPKDEEFMFIGFDPEHPENYIYTGVFMDCIRAVDLLVSRPEIDAKRIGIEGGSQGGGLSFATAALDDRIIFCAPDIPWLGDWVGYLQTEYWGWDNYPKLLIKYTDLTFAGVNEFLSYFDTMNMAEWITCPVLMSVGLQDRVCPPRTSFAPYNAVRSAKEYRVYPFAGHATWWEHSAYKNQWMAQRLSIERIGEN